MSKCRLSVVRQVNEAGVRSSGHPVAQRDWPLLKCGVTGLLARHKREIPVTLEELAREGCAIGTYMSPPCPVAVIEISGIHLFWVTQFPEDQHHTHVMDFDRMEHVGDVGITFYEGDRVVAYVATYREFPSVSLQDFVNERTRWLEYLSDPDNRAGFESFVRSERDILLSHGDVPPEDETQERIDEPTPNGGMYSIAYFSDAEGNPTTKENATRMEIVEFDRDGKQIHRTYMEKG